MRSHDRDETEEMLLAHREEALLMRDENMLDTVEMLLAIRAEWKAQGCPAYWQTLAHGGNKPWLN
jgi:hypothetical protein